MKIQLPNDIHWPERRYAAEALFVDVLGLPVDITFSETQHPTLLLDNGKQLVLEDHFFRLHPVVEKSWLTQNDLPGQVFFQQKSDNPFLPETDMPIFFGNEKLHISEDKIVCGIDIFAATFYMLTRWEEYVIPDRDVHGRFPAKASLAGRFNFLHRPVVNEMGEMLWAMLLQLGCTVRRKPRRFEVLLTHDVDMPLRWRSFPLFVKKLGGDLLKRHSLNEFLFSIRSYFATTWGKGKDPFDTFDYLMDCADHHGLQSHFFFLCGGDTPFDRAMPIDTPFIKDLIGKIHDRGHAIGIHPSYDTFYNGAIMGKEKERLEQATGFPVKSGRQHFLRFEAPTTWQIWEYHGMKWDSSLYYAEQAGFRCGICCSFTVFNFLTREKLRLREVPLTAMEVTWTTYSKASPTEMLNEMTQLRETVRMYNGTFVLLWHNSSFNTPEWETYASLYRQLLEK